MYVVKHGQLQTMPMQGEMKDIVTVIPALHNQEDKRTALGTELHVPEQLDLLEERNANL